MALATMTFYIYHHQSAFYRLMMILIEKAAKTGGKQLRATDYHVITYEMIAVYGIHRGLKFLPPHEWP